jgi:beta-glucosidase
MSEETAKMQSKGHVGTWPPEFVWGVSTSSFQIEGATKEGGRGPSIWDTFGAAGRCQNKDTGDVACDHYNRFEEDVALMRDLGIDAYRFSIAWPRVLPLGRGKPNKTGLDFYDRLIDALLEANIEPWICLYHWDLPQALDDHGGWLVRDSAGWFADYATLVARRYGDRVKRWATFNEFSVFTIFGYGFGESAPGHSAGTVPLQKAVHYVNLAHGAGVDVLRAHVPHASIGAIHNYQPIIPSSASHENAAALFATYWNQAHPDPQILGAYPTLIADAMERYMEPGDLARICRPIDWFGLNHYSPIYAQTEDNDLGFGFGPHPPEIERTPINWPIHPEAFRDTLIGVSDRYSLPIYVTENGYGSQDQQAENGTVEDPKRVEFLTNYINAVKEAMARGADVRGYFVWSLLDNFEWGSGYGVRFGLVYVDYPTQRRIPKASYTWFADLIKSTRLSRERRQPAPTQAGRVNRFGPI